MHQNRDKANNQGNTTNDATPVLPTLSSNIGTVTGVSTTAQKQQAQFEVLPRNGQIGWTGADGDVSVAISGGRTGRRSLWAYADTLVAKYDAKTDSRVSDGFHMPHSTVALIELNDDGSSGKVEYFWKADQNGNVTSFFVPSDEQVAAGEILWPVAGLASRDGRSVLFLASRVRVDPENNSINLVGTTAIVIPDVHMIADPREWKYTTHDVGTATLTWFSAVFFAEPEGDQVYLFGHEGADQLPGTPTVLSRASFSDLLNQDWEKREYWIQPGDWSKDPSNLKTLDKLLTWETTCTWVNDLGLWCSFWIPFLEPSVYLFTAESITGEWSATKILDIPAPFNADPWFSYGSKAHPELQPCSQIIGSPGQVNLVYTYVSNLNTLGMSADQALPLMEKYLFGPGSMSFPQRGYWPRYMNVTITRAPSV